MTNSEGKSGHAGLLQAFLEHKRILVAYLARFSLRPEDVDDIMQESFARSFDASGRTSIDSPKSYLFMTARNLVFRQLRQQGRFLRNEIEQIDELAGPAPGAALDVQLHNEQKMAVLLDAARSLPPQCRRVFLMRKFYGLSHKEIAAQLNISQSTVERHISNAIKRCRIYMGKKGFGTNEAPLSSPAQDKTDSG